MKTLGWIYITAYCIDAVVSTIATLIPETEPVSNIICYVPE